MSKNNGKVNIPLFAAAVLLCMTLFTTHLTSGLYARYTTTDSGSDGARVAKWHIALNVEPAPDKTFVGNMDENYTEAFSYDFSIGTDSEVAAKYSITVTFSQGLEETITPSIAGGTLHSSTADRKSFTFTSDSWTFAPGAATTPHTLTLTRVYFQPNQTPEPFSNVQVSISVLAEQIN